MGVSSLQASVNRLNNLSQIMYTANNNGFGIMEVRKPAQRNMLQQQQQQHWPPLKCPRCNSTNTKFCYYNNYSKTQPRYLCKACRRHWTEGGTLRDVPVGGGRKNKRVKVATDNQLISAAASTSNASEMINNSNNSAVQRLLNANPSSNKVPEMLRHVLLQPAQQVFPLQLQAPAHTISPDFGIMSGLLGPRDIVSNNLGPYNNVPNDTFSVSGYAAHTGTRGDTDTSMVPPVQLGTGNWSTWIEDISGLATNLDVKPPTNGGC